MIGSAIGIIFLLLMASIAILVLGAIVVFTLLHMFHGTHNIVTGIGWR